MEYKAAMEYKAVMEYKDVMEHRPLLNIGAFRSGNRTWDTN